MTRKNHNVENEIVIHSQEPKAPLAKADVRITCTETQYHDLWSEFDKHRGEEIKVTRRGLENAIEDFTSSGQKSPTDLFASGQTRQNSKMVAVRRASLWEFLQNLTLLYGEWEAQGLRLPQ